MYMQSEWTCVSIFSELSLSFAFSFLSTAGKTHESLKSIQKNNNVNLISEEEELGPPIKNIMPSTSR